MSSECVLGEIDALCNVEYGTRVVQKKDGGTIYPVYGGGGATFAMDSYNRENRLVIARFAMSKQCTRFVSGKFFLNDSGLTISPKDKMKIDQNFLDYYCLAMNDLFYSISRGTAQKNLDVPIFRKIKINIPRDIKLQQNIVKKLDVIFAEIDKAVAATEANIKNAEALFQSYLTEVLGRSDIGWLNRELITICEIFADGDWIESKDQSDSGIRLIQTGNVGFGKFKNRDSKARYISEETFKRLRCTEIKEGDILVSRLPDPVGRACIIPELTEKSITAVDCTIIRTKQEIINPRFLNYFFQSPQYFERVKKNITGATRQRISRSLLGKILVPIAPLLIQQNIVEKLDAISEEIDKAQTLFNQKNSEFILLKQSILKQAFSGELVQDLR